MNIEKIIFDYVRHNDINEDTFSNLTGISQSELRAISNGKRKLKADELIMFCEYFGLDCGFFNNCKRYNVEC